MGIRWLMMSTSPMVATTDCRPSISGTQAASSEPNTSTRISSVNGTDQHAGLPQLLVEQLGDRLVGAHRAGLPDIELGVEPGDGRDRRG